MLIDGGAVDEVALESAFAVPSKNIVSDAFDSNRDQATVDGEEDTSHQLAKNNPQTLTRSLQTEPVTIPVYINCGGADYTSSDKLSYQADEYFVNGRVFHNSYLQISDTDDPILFQSNRYSAPDDYGISYEIPVGEGDYTVVFHFAELVFGAIGKRQFDVTVEDKLIWSKLDVFEEAGGKRKPLWKRRRTLVSDGSLSLRFDSIVSNAMISAIEVVRTKSTGTGDSSPLVSSLPVPNLSVSPAAEPSSSPSVFPVAIQSPQPTFLQVADPTSHPAASPTRQPTTHPASVPTQKPTEFPVAHPVSRPTIPPVSTVPTPDVEPILVNVGGGYFTDLYNRNWEADFLYAFGGQTFSEVFPISGTEDDYLYTSERYGNVRYEFEIPAGDYDVVLHFAENFYYAQGKRVFDIHIQNKTAFENVDILKLTGGVRYQAVTLESTQVVSTGKLTIELIKLNSGEPKLCGIEVGLVAPHLAHAVSGGPYTAVATRSDGNATVHVDGHASHTHGPGLILVEWIWKVNSQVVGTGEETDIILPRGEHILTLFVADDAGNESAESTTVTVYSSDYPSIQSISPVSGTILGGDLITISGSGFTYAASLTVVHMGDANLTTTDIVVVNSTTISFVSPITTIATPQPIAVSTPLGKSNTLEFTYIDGNPIAFTEKKIFDVYSPSTVAFGPDEKLYVGTVDGWLYKLTLDNSLNVVETVSSSIVQDPSTSKIRTILGIAFDPLDTSDIPNVYVSHTHSFHGCYTSSSGACINGKVSIVSGSNMDQIQDVVTGLPASDHDHGEFLSWSNDSKHLLTTLTHNIFYVFI